MNHTEILSHLRRDALSTAKQNAALGQRYYLGDHDIKNYRLFFYDAAGSLVEDSTRSNIKIAHPFFTELVDQQVQYMLSGGGPFIRSQDPQLQSYLSHYFGEDFNAELYDVLTGAVVKGSEYLYAYRSADGRLAFQCADSLGVTEITPEESGDGRSYYLYRYLQRRGSKTVTRVQLWDDQETWYFTLTDQGGLVPDTDTPEAPNPRPHVLYTKTGDDDTYFEGLGFVPFFRLDNDRDRRSALLPVKALIDDYDLMSCGLSNNLQDASEYLVVVKGFQGDSLDELMSNIRTKKHIGVDAEAGGDVEFKTVTIPYEARKVKLELDEKNIYRFGMGFNAAQTGDGNITNVVIKSRYALLDMKCSKLELRLRQFLSKVVSVVLEEINLLHNTDYTMEDITFDFRRQVMTNALDNAQIDQLRQETRHLALETLRSGREALSPEEFRTQLRHILLDEEV